MEVKVDILRFPPREESIKTCEEVSNQGCIKPEQNRLCDPVCLLVKFSLLAGFSEVFPCLSRCLPSSSKYESCLGKRTTNEKAHTLSSLVGRVVKAAVHMGVLFQPKSCIKT